jgi:hypothetical protein
MKHDKNKNLERESNDLDSFQFLGDKVIEIHVAHKCHHITKTGTRYQKDPKVERELQKHDLNTEVYPKAEYVLLSDH